MVRKTWNVKEEGFGSGWGRGDEKEEREGGREEKR